MLSSPLIHSFVIAAFAALIVTAAVGDFREFRIPNRLVVAIVALYPAHVLGSPVPVHWPMALGLAGLVFAIGVGFFAAKMMGGGDVKLMGAVALWAAPFHLISLFVITLAGALMVALVMATRTAAAESRDGGSFSLGATVANLRHVPILKMSVPYGVGIAAGGLYVAYRLLAG